MKKRLNKYNKWWRLACWWVLALGMAHVSYAQVRPVTANLVLAPPYTLTLNDYTSPTSNKLSVYLFLRDNNISGRKVRLRFSLVNPNNVRVVTNDAFFLAQPGFTLNAGAPLILNGSDPRLRRFFELPNLALNMSTNDLNQFRQSKRLPSGVYTWQVEVFDFNRPNVPLSNANLSRQTIWMVLNQPPIVNLPQQNQKLRATDYGLQNVVFQWLNRSASSPNSAFTTQYQVFLYEVYEPNGPVSNPLAAPRNLVYQSTAPLTNTTLIYNNTFPALTAGKRYIFQVQAQDIQRHDLFENQGFSEAVVFQYGETCLPPGNVKGAPIDHQRLHIEWESLANQTSFVVRYRPIAGNASWTEATSRFNDLTLKNLEKNTEYEFEVRSVCGGLNGANWVRGQAKTLDKGDNEENFVCGVPKGTYDLSNQTPLEALKNGDVISAGGYQITVRRATGGTGQFSGVGITRVPVGRIKVKFKVGFKDIFINADKKMLRGNIHVVRSNWKARKFAKKITVDAWLTPKDGQVQIKTPGGEWQDLPIGKDYLLVDPVSEDDLFVDRNGVAHIPIEDRDYSNLTPEEIVKEIKKLKEEADEAIADGRWGDALKLADKAIELAEKIGESAEQIKEALKKLFDNMKDLVKESLEEIKNKSKEVKESLVTKADVAQYNKLRKEVVNEDRNYSINNGKKDAKSQIKVVSVVVPLDDKVEVGKTNAEINKSAKAKKLAEKINKIKSKLKAIQWEKLKVDQILRYLQDPSKFQDLLKKAKNKLNGSKDKLLDALVADNTDQLKHIIKTEVNKILDEIVQEFIEKNEK